MGGMSRRQSSHFSDRIKRIESGGMNTSGTLYAGLDQGQQTRKRVKKKQKALDRSEAFSAIFMVPLAFFCGLAAMLAGRIGAFRVLQQPEAIPAEYAQIFPLVGDVGIAALLALILAMIFGLGNGSRLIMLMIGFTGVMLFESSIVKLAPEAFSSLYSEEYVAEVVAGAPENPFTPEALGL